MRILVACEESQAVCKAFRARGHKAFSCDIMPCSGGHPEWHIQGDVLPLLKEKWDMIIAFPPCTYLSNAGSLNIYRKGKIFFKHNDGFEDEERIKKAQEAKLFFMHFFNANCPKICIENPVPAKRWELPKCSQIIQPYEFGHRYSKRTCLWLKGLPPLMATEIVKKIEPWVYQKKINGVRKRNSAKIKSKTFQGVAEAMAEQWGGE